MVFTNYQNDFEGVYYTVPFIFFISETNNTENSYTIQEIVPLAIQGVLFNLDNASNQKLVGCYLPKDISPRLIKIYADDNNVYSFMFPFNYADTNFVSTINQIRESLIIMRYTVIGEKINTDKLNFILKINGYV